MRSLLIAFLCVFTIRLPMLAIAQASSTTEKASSSITRLIHKEALQPHILNGARMRLLQSNTGLSTDEISRLYMASGARYFGQFACAMLVSQRLKLDRDAVLHGLFTTNLGQVLREMGVERAVASQHILAAARELGAAEKTMVR